MKGDDPFLEVIVKVYDIETKAIVFTGAIHKAAKFLQVSDRTISDAAKKKRRIKGKKYCVRLAPHK